MSKGARRQGGWCCTTLALAALLNGTGCLRFAYNEVDRKPTAAPDGGMDAGVSQNRADASTQPDAQPTAAGGSGGVGGRAAGAGGSRSNGGSGGSSQPGVDAGDAAVTDASVDSDAAAVGGGGGAGGTSSGGAGGTSSGGAGGAGGVGKGGTGGAGGSVVGMGGAGGVGGAGGASGTGGSGGSAGTFVSIPFAQCMQGTGVKFCSGFEEPTYPWTNDMPWTFDRIMNGSDARSTNPTYKGSTASGRFTTTGSSAGNTFCRIATTKDTDHLKSGNLWMRYYYYIPTTTVINQYFSAGVMSELESPFRGFSLIVRQSRLTMETALPGFTIPNYTYTFPRNTWVCLEHHVFIDSSNGFFEIYMNGGLTPVLKSTTGNTIPANGYTTSEVGIHYVADGQNTVTVNVDNVVVSTSRFGCDAP